MELQRLKSRKKWRSHRKAQPIGRWTMHRITNSVTDCHYFTKSFSFYLNANDSTPFYACVSVLFHSYVQLARSFKWNSCSHASPLNNTFLSFFCKTPKVVKYGNWELENMERNLEAFRNSDGGWNAAPRAYRPRKHTWRENLAGGKVLCGGKRSSFCRRRIG